jgi:hypothetical protein
MTNQAFIDKLLDLSKNHSEEIAELWYKALIENPRTASYRNLTKDHLIYQSSAVYRNLRQLFFADNPYDEIKSFLGSIRYAEYACEHNIPLHEAVYAIILMRRYIWLHADEQAILYNSSLEMYQALESINRTILMFDYAIYDVIQRYGEIAKDETSRFLSSKSRHP